MAEQGVRETGGAQGPASDGGDDGEACAEAGVDASLARLGKEVGADFVEALHALRLAQHDAEGDE